MAEQSWLCSDKLSTHFLYLISSSESGMHTTIHANVSKCHKLFQHRTGNDTTVSVYMHLLKEELNGWTHPLSLSFWRLWFTWKTCTRAHTPSAEILLFLRLQKVMQQKQELFKLQHQCITYLTKLALCQKESKTKFLVRSWNNTHYICSAQSRDCATVVRNLQICANYTRTLQLTQKTAR